MKYTVAEFKKNTRKVLNEALERPVTIIRYDEEFVLTTASKIEPSKGLISEVLQEPKAESTPLTEKALNQAVETIQSSFKEPTTLVSRSNGKSFDFCKHDAVKGLCKHGCR